MSLSDDLLVILSNYSGGYRLMRARMHGYEGPAGRNRSGSRNPSSDHALRVALSRLKKRGLAGNRSQGWSITKRGRAYLAKKLLHKKYVLSEKREKTMIIAFDIPERHKKKRQWLRVELVHLGFEMLQKSVWLGPAPLPEMFISSLNDIGIITFMKFFEAKESDII